MNRITAELLPDAYNAAVEIGEITEGLSFEAYLNARTTRLATERLFEILGEALVKAKREAPNLIKSIDGAEAAIGMRNRIIHGYNEVDHMTVWATAIDEVPEFRLRLSRLLETAGYSPHDVDGIE